MIQIKKRQKHPKQQEIKEIVCRLVLYNQWRRGDDDLEQPCPNQLGKDIDAAVDLIKDRILTV